MPTASERCKQWDDIREVTKAFQRHEAQIIAAEELVKTVDASLEGLGDARAALQTTSLDKVIRDLVSKGQIEVCSLISNESTDSDVSLAIDSLVKTKSLLERDQKNACRWLTERISDPHNGFLSQLEIEAALRRESPVLEGLKYLERLSQSESIDTEITDRLKDLWSWLEKRSSAADAIIRIRDRVLEREFSDSDRDPTKVPRCYHEIADLHLDELEQRIAHESKFSDIFHIAVSSLESLEFQSPITNGRVGRLETAVFDGGERQTDALEGIKQAVERRGAAVRRLEDEQKGFEVAGVTMGQKL